MQVMAWNAMMAHKLVGNQPSSQMIKVEAPALDSPDTARFVPPVKHSPTANNTFVHQAKSTGCLNSYFHNN